MNDIFNIKRFAWLFKKTVAERPVQNIGVMMLLLVLSSILYIVVKKIYGIGAAQNITLYSGLVVGGFFLASFVFGYFNTNASGSSYLTLPASFLEKWLCGVLIAGVFFLLLFLSFFHLMDVVFVAVYHNSLDPTSPFYKEQYKSVYTFDLNGIVAWRVYSQYLLLTGAMLTGGLYFNKISFVKTSITICIGILLIFGLNWLIATVLFTNVNDALPYDHVTLLVGKETGTLILPAKLDTLFHAVLAYILPAILWLLPLLRLREKEF